MIRYLRGVQPRYDICKIVWNYFAPQYADKEELIVAACECSLMYENLIRFFIISLSTLSVKKRNY